MRVSRLAEVWNKLPLEGLKPVKKFTDRKTGVARIWAIQDLTPVPAPVAQAANKKAVVPAMLRGPGGDVGPEHGSHQLAAPYCVRVHQRCGR